VYENRGSHLPRGEGWGGGGAQTRGRTGGLYKEKKRNDNRGKGKGAYNGHEQESRGEHLLHGDHRFPKEPYHREIGGKWSYHKKKAKESLEKGGRTPGERETGKGKETSPPLLMGRRISATPYRRE